MHAENTGPEAKLDMSMCRHYHHHIVEIVDRLIEGVKDKGSSAAVNIADIAQVQLAATGKAILALSKEALCWVFSWHSIPAGAVVSLVTWHQNRLLLLLYSSAFNACAEGEL